MIIMPIFQDRSARFSYEIELNNEIFYFRFYWNSREESWFFDIQDQNEINILTNIRLVINYFLLNTFEYIEELPKGNFKVWDLEENPVTGGITFDNLGSRYQLFFLTDEELETGEIDTSGI